MVVLHVLLKVIMMLFQVELALEEGLVGNEVVN